MLCLSKEGLSAWGSKRGGGEVQMDCRLGTARTILESAGLTQAIMTVRAFPPRLSCMGMACKRRGGGGGGQGRGGAVHKGGRSRRGQEPGLQEAGQLVGSVGDVPGVWLAERLDAVPEREQPEVDACRLLLLHPLIALTGAHQEVPRRRSHP